MPHEQRDIGLEVALGFTTQVPHQPLRVKGILRRHSVPHDGIEETLALTGIETEHLDVSTDASQKRRQRPIVATLQSPLGLPLASILVIEAVDLNHCLRAFTSEEKLEQWYHCSHCKGKKPATKKLQIWKLPPILVSGCA